MQARALASVLFAPGADFPKAAAVAGCGCGGGGCGSCQPGSFPPGKTPCGPPGNGGGNGNGRGSAVPTPVPIMVGNEAGAGTNIAYYNSVKPSSGCAEGESWCPPAIPYWDMVRDALYMTMVVGEATIAGGASTEISIQPTMGWFDGFYVEIYAVDAANPQTRQRVRVGRFSVGDCPGDCRTISVFSDAFEANEACCNGRPLRARFGRANDGNDLRVTITNPNVGGSVTAQVIVRGYCHRGSCAC